jgi:hypothetical protein
LLFKVKIDNETILMGHVLCIKYEIFEKEETCQCYSIQIIMPLNNNNNKIERIKHLNEN